MMPNFDQQASRFESETSPDYKFIELGMSLLRLDDIPSAEIQTEDFNLRLSSSSTESLLYCQNLTQSESDEDDELSTGKKFEQDSQICDDVCQTETMTLEPPTIAECFINLSQETTDNKASECTDPENMKEESRLQLCESVSEIHHSSTNMEVIKPLKPRNLPLLQLQLLNTKECCAEAVSIKRMLYPVWRMIATHRYAGPFLKPVGEKQAPGYTEIVKRPMDLRTIKRKLSQGVIKTKAEFQRDVLLMLQNCAMYNHFHDSLHQRGLEMQRDVMELLQVLNLQVYWKS